MPSLFSTRIFFNPSLPSNPTAVTFFSAILASGILPISDSTSISRLSRLMFGIGWLRSCAQSDTASWNSFAVSYTHLTLPTSDLV